MSKIAETSNISLPQFSSPSLSSSTILKNSLKRPREDGNVDEAEQQALQQCLSNENNSHLSPLAEKPKKVKLIGLDGTDGSVNSDKENGKLDYAQNDAFPMSPQSKVSTHGEFTQQEKLAERERKRLEKEEEKRKKAEEKAEREAAKQAKQQQKEEERKRKEEEKTRKEEEKKRKEEEKKKKEEEKKRKEEEKRQKEEEKRQRELEKEQERQKKEQEKKLKQLEKEKAKEEKRKKQEEEEDKKKKEETKQKSIINFGFVTVKKSTKPEDSEWDKWYMPFHIPAGATVAPHIRVQSLSNSEIEAQITKGETIPVLLAQFKKKEAEKRSLVPKKPKTQVHPQEEDRDIPNQPMPLRKMKLLLFHDNIRPAYFGTFSKASKVIKGRKPFVEDKDILDYEFDSDAEWEDVSEGEDVDKSDAEEDEEPEKEPTDPDNEEEEFVVPDNYLSDDEGIKEEADMAALNDPQLREERRKKLLELSKIKNLQSISDVAKSVTGPVFGVTPGDSNYEKLKMYKMIPLLPLPIDPTAEQSEPEANPNTASPRKRGRFPDEAVPQLLELVHGNACGMEKLVAEMHTRFPTISELQIKKKIKEVAVKERREGKSAWYVHSHLLSPQQQSQQSQQQQKPPTAKQLFTTSSVPINNITLPPISQFNFGQHSFPLPTQVFQPQMMPQDMFYQHTVQQPSMAHRVVPHPIVLQNVAQPITAPQPNDISQSSILAQPKVVPQQPVLPFAPAQAPVITPQPKPVNVLQIKRAPKPVTSSPVKPIQTFFSNPSSTNNDTPTLPQPTPMAVESQQVIPVLANPGLTLDLNDLPSDHVLE